MKARLIFLYVISFLLNASAFSDAIPDAKELLNQFSKARERAKSFVVKGQAVTKFSYPTRNWSGTGYMDFELCYDGSRSKEKTRIWGNVNSINQDVKEEQAHYSSSLWDGDNKFKYTQGGPAKIGHLIITSKEFLENPNLFKGLGQISGYTRGDRKNIKELLLTQSQTLKVRKEIQNITGSNCYVIETMVKNKGTYTLWIDPEHDYHIARIRVQRKSGDFIKDIQLQEGDYSNQVFEVLEFEKTDGIWFPKKCRSKISKKLKRYNLLMKEERIKTYTEIIFDPDHNKLQSFNTNDIPNGTPTKLRSRPPSENYIWQDGKVVFKSSSYELPPEE